MNMHLYILHPSLPNTSQRCLPRTECNSSTATPQEARHSPTAQQPNSPTTTQQWQKKKPANSAWVHIAFPIKFKCNGTQCNGPQSLHLRCNPCHTKQHTCLRFKHRSLCVLPPSSSHHCFSRGIKNQRHNSLCTSVAHSCCKKMASPAWQG